MQGLIRTFLPDKRYGFIHGDDGRDYYFHLDSFGNADDRHLVCDEANVVFEPAATPKGYRARSCRLVTTSDLTSYRVPDDVLTSRSTILPGWEVVEWGDWLIHAASDDSPDGARRQLVSRARQLGANALIGVEYYKTTGLRPGTGWGTHQYTVHNFRARPMIVARKHADGRYRREDLTGLNVRAAAEKRRYVSRMRRRTGTWLLIVFLSALILYVSHGGDDFPAWAAISAMVLFQVFRELRTDFEDWLERAESI